MLQAAGRGVWTVADGMGGHDAGKLASALVADTLADLPDAGSLEALEREARRRLGLANTRLLEEGRQRRARIVGSTVVVLLARGHSAIALWAGDSRLYRFDGRRVELLTTDHSRVQELIASGQLRREQAEQHPEANVITRALGVSETLELDRCPVPVENGDTFLLCSDGLSRYVNDDEIAAALADPSCQQACDRLIQAALATPARDNITAVVVRASADQSDLRTRINTRPVTADDPTEPAGG